MSLSMSRSTTRTTAIQGQPQFVYYIVKATCAHYIIIMHVVGVLHVHTYLCMHIYAVMHTPTNTFSCTHTIEQRAAAAVNSWAPPWNFFIFKRIIIYEHKRIHKHATNAHTHTDTHTHTHTHTNTHMQAHTRIDAYTRSSL